MTIKVTTTNDVNHFTGMWAEDERCVMSLITDAKEIREYSKDSLPYVCVYIKDEDGKIPSLPYALNYQNNELSLQIPKSKNSELKIISMSKILKLIEAAGI